MQNWSSCALSLSLVKPWAIVILRLNRAQQLLSGQSSCPADNEWVAQHPGK